MPARAPPCAGSSSSAASRLRRLPAALCASTLTACTMYPVAPAGDAQLQAAIDSLDIAPDAAVLVGAGDIAMCGRLSPAEATSRLLDAVIAAAPDAIVFTTGDHAYPDGTPEEFARCYEPTWGTHNTRTRPTPGNHDYATPGAEGYFDYFDVFDARPEARPVGYYDFELNGWRIFALNSLLSLTPQSLQVRWLERQLAAAPADCILAYWHNPLFSSGFHGINPFDSGRDTAVLWRPLIRHGADVIVNGHDHLYERYAPQDAEGRPTPTGPRQFVIGSGGAGLHRVLHRSANLQYLNNDVFGVLILMLRPGGYEWAFIGIDGIVHDRSSAPVACTPVSGARAITTGTGRGTRP